MHRTHPGKGCITKVPASLFGGHSSTKYPRDTDIVTVLGGNLGKIDMTTPSYMSELHTTLKFIEILKVGMMMSVPKPHPCSDRKT